MQLVDTWEGRGSVRLVEGAVAAIRYEIDLWQIADKAVIGRGYVEGDKDAMHTIRSARGPISLSLSDGTAVSAVLVERGAGRNWADVYVPRPLPDVIPAAWPDARPIALGSVARSTGVAP